MFTAFNRNACAANAYWVSLSLFLIPNIRSLVRFCNKVLEWLCNIYNDWQIWAICLYLMLPKSWQICSWDPWNTFLRLWGIFFFLFLDWIHIFEWYMHFKAVWMSIHQQNDKKCGKKIVKLIHQLSYMNGISYGICQ